MPGKLIEMDKPTPNVARDVNKIFMARKMGISDLRPGFNTQQPAVPQKAPQTPPAPILDISDSSESSEEISINSIIANKPDKKIVREYFKNRIEELEEAADDF